MTIQYRLVYIIWFYIYVIEKDSLPMKRSKAAPIIQAWMSIFNKTKNLPKAAQPMVQQTIQQIMTTPLNLPKPRPKLLMSTKINQRNICEERNDENITGGSAAENTALLSKYRRILNENPDQEVDIQLGCSFVYRR